MILVLLLSVNIGKACSGSSGSIVSQVDNGNGTFTYTLDLTTEIDIAVDSTFYGFIITFNSTQNTPVISPGGYPAGLTTSDLTTGTIVGSLVGVTGNSVNSIVGDPDWDPYYGQVNSLSYESSESLGASFNDFSLTISITVEGCVESIEFFANVNSGSAACQIDLSTGVTCPVICRASTNLIWD